MYLLLVIRSTIVSDFLLEIMDFVANSPYNFLDHPRRMLLLLFKNLPVSCFL